MSIDERLDRLTERHEALAQSLELLTLDIRHLTANVGRISVKVDMQGDRMETMMAGFNVITELLRRPDARLDGLEGR